MNKIEIIKLKEIQDKFMDLGGFMNPSNPEKWAEFLYDFIFEYKKHNLGKEWLEPFFKNIPAHLMQKMLECTKKSYYFTESIGLDISWFFKELVDKCNERILKKGKN